VPFAGDCAHAGGHLLNHDQRDRRRDQRPQKFVAELRSGLGIREDAAGVVIDVGRDEARTEDRQKCKKAGADQSERRSTANGSLTHGRQ